MARMTEADRADMIRTQVTSVKLKIEELIDLGCVKELHELWEFLTDRMPVKEERRVSLVVH